MTAITTTLNDIRSKGPCQPSWKKLLAHLGKTKADDEPLAFLTILDSNGIDDTIWCFRTKPHLLNLGRHFDVDCAERVEHLMQDDRSKQALRVARRFSNGQATLDELTSAGDAAWIVAGSVPGDGAWDGAWNAAGEAAWSAAWASAKEDAVAGNVAGSAAAREAAWAAAWNAAWNSGGNSGGNAAVAAVAKAALEAERRWQTERLSYLLNEGDWSPIKEQS